MSFCKVIKKHSNPTCMCHAQFKSQIRKENACLVLQPLSPTASFHALVSLLPANAALTAKAMAVRHSLEQRSQLYLASSWRCASCPRFRAIRGAWSGHILPGRGMSPTRAAALSLICEQENHFSSCSSWKRQMSFWTFKPFLRPDIQVENIR